MGESVDLPPIPEQMGDAQIPAIKAIGFSSKNQQKALLELINQKIERYNTLVQNPKKNNADVAMLLLQEIEYAAHFLMDHSDPNLASPGRNWYLTSGIALQPGRFEQRISQGLAAKVKKENDTLDFAALFAEAESAGVDKKVVDALKAKLNSEPYRNSTASIKNYTVLQQLRKATLYATMISNYKKPGPLQELLKEIDSHLYAVIQAEPKLQQQYLLQQKYARYFDTFYSPAKKQDALDFMHALTMVETHLLNASDETIIEFYKNNPLYGIIAQKTEDLGKEDDKEVTAKGRKVSIDDLKAEWVKSGARTLEQLKALAPALFKDNDLQFLAAGNNITWRLKNKDSGEYLILRASKQKLTNLDHIDTLKDTLAGEYFSAEYATLIGAIDEGDRMEDYTLSLIQYCSKGNLQHVRKNIPSEDSALIQKEASNLLSSFTDFCARLIDEQAYLTDIKLSNFLVDEISDLKSIRVCAAGADVHSLSRNDITGDITPLYAPPEWDGSYTIVERSPLPDSDAHKMGEIYYDKTTQQYSVLGYNGEFYQGEAAELGDSKKQANTIRKIEKDIRFDMDKFMSYQLGLALYDFLTGLTITLEGESNAERNEARAEALEQLKAFKESGVFDYSAAVFQGPEGKVFRELCTAMLKTNPKERMSVKEAAAKLDALKLHGPKAELLQGLHEAAYLRTQAMLQDAMERYKTHNEQFNADPAFLKNYQAMQTFLAEVTEAKIVTRDTDFFAHALESEALRLDSWLQHAVAQSHNNQHFYPHYSRSLLNEGFKAHLLSSDHKLHQLSRAAAGSNHAEEKEALLQQITTIRHSLDITMNYFLSTHRSDVAATPTIEFAKIFAATSTLETYIDVLKTHFADLGANDLQLMQERLAMPTDDLAQHLRKEALYLQYSVLYAQKDEKQGVPPHLRALRQSLIYNFLENNPNATANLSQDLEQHLATLFNPENSNGSDLIDHAQRYQQNISSEKYPEAYREALESNKQIMGLYSKFLGDDDEDPIVAQMTQLRAEMKKAYKEGVVSAQGSAETLHKVNLELVNSINYLAGPKLSFKPVHREEEWEKLKEDSVNITSTKKKWAHRVLMGVGVSLALVLTVGTGGVAAAPILAANIASAVSPTIANSAIGLITSSSISARMQRVMRSSKKEIESSDRVFNTAASIADSLANKATPVGSPNKPMATPISSLNSGLFHHGTSHVGPQKKDDDSEGSKDSGSHVDPIHK